MVTKEVSPYTKFQFRNIAKNRYLAPDRNIAKNRYLAPDRNIAKNRYLAPEYSVGM